MESCGNQKSVNQIKAIFFIPPLVTTQLIGANALRRKEIPQIAFYKANLLIEMVTTSWSWLRERQECAKLSSRQRVATLKNLKYKIYFDLFYTFVVTTWSHMCYFTVVMSSLLFYNVENSLHFFLKTWMCRCVQTVLLVLCVQTNKRVYFLVCRLHITF